MSVHDHDECECLRLEPRAQFDPAIVGVVKRFHSTFLLYDLDAVVALLVAEGMSEEEAIEHFEFNIIGGWVGEGTPGFLVKEGEE